MENQKTCFVIFVGYRAFGVSETNVNYICSTEEKAKAKLETAVENAINDLQMLLEAKRYTYQPDRLIRNTSDFCVKLTYFVANNKLEYNIFYNEIPID